MRRNLLNAGRLQSLFARASLSSFQPVNHPSYERLQDFQVKEYGLNATIFKHKKSGAQVMSMVAPDDNKVFGISFRTPPTDSTGIPHILEHSVLCGSRKYPVKEPFVELLRGSLQNFLNAFTYPDRTCYPIASTNTKDFYNLANVYLDAVFFPRAINDPQVLQQEGWHYELENPEAPLTIKGVVYNEMKGVYSSPEAILGRETQLALFPHNTYGVDSGGDPKDIPNLTFDQFKSFHAKYYHPSNSRIFFYGDDNQLERLNLLDSYLNEFQSLSINDLESSKIHYQKKMNLIKPWSERMKIHYPITADTEPKHMLTVNWLINDQPFTPKEALGLHLLDYLLLGTSTSELKQTLLDSNLGESLVGGGLSDELLQATYSIGLKGISRENVEKLQPLILQTLEKVAQSGFKQDAINAAINTVEFRLREFNTGSYPKGLAVMLAMLKPWIYDRSPLEGIVFEEALQSLKKDIADGKPLFQDLIKKYLLSNQHRLTVEMIPDMELEFKQTAAEKEHLQKIKSSFTPKQIEEIIKQTELLREAQERIDSPEAKATIPKLTLQDIERENKEYPINILPATSNFPATILTHPLTSSGILYVDLLLDYSQIDIEDIPYIPIFTRLMMETDTKTYNESQLNDFIGSNTGGLSLTSYQGYRHQYQKENPSIGILSNVDEAQFYMMFRSKVVKGKISTLFPLIEEILLTSRLSNQKRAITLLREFKAYKESAILSNGHSYGATRFGATNSLLGYYSEITAGLTSVRQASILLKEAEENWESFQLKLEKIRNILIQNIIQPSSSSSAGESPRFLINLTGDEDLLTASQPIIQSFVSSIQEKNKKQASTTTTIPSSSTSMGKGINAQWQEQKNSLMYPLRNEGFIIPSLVNYVVLGGNLFQSNERISGSTAVINHFLSNGYLWDQVRVLGGAYGGFSRFSALSGRLLFLSYRDPNLLNTINIYEQTGEFLKSMDIHSDEILQSIIGSIGDLDNPLSADQKGYSSMIQYISNETKEYRQQWRNDIISTNHQDFQSFIEKLDRFLADHHKKMIIVFGSQEALETANKDLPEEKKLVLEPALISSSASANSAANNNNNN